MKNLITAITHEEKKRLEDFIFNINQIQDIDGLKGWIYTDLLPKGKDTSKMSFAELKSYLIKRKEKAIYKEIEREVNKIKTVFNAGELIDVKIQIEWKRSQMWGNNPVAEAWAYFKDKDGNHNSHYVKTRSIGGCGYDKQSTAVAECLNQLNEVLKPLYALKDDSLFDGAGKKNHDLFGYGSGYGILPHIEGGVGVSCYPRIFEKIGYIFETVASGKSFDAYKITKK